MKYNIKNQQKAKREALCGSLGTSFQSYFDSIPRIKNHIDHITSHNFASNQVSFMISVLMFSFVHLTFSRVVPSISQIRILMSKTVHKSETGKQKSFFSIKITIGEEQDTEKHPSICPPILKQANRSASAPLIRTKGSSTAPRQRQQQHAGEISAQASQRTEEVRFGNKYLLHLDQSSLRHCSTAPALFPPPPLPRPLICSTTRSRCSFARVASEAHSSHVREREGGTVRYARDAGACAVRTCRASQAALFYDYYP